MSTTYRLSRAAVMKLTADGRLEIHGSVSTQPVYTDPVGALVLAKFASPTSLESAGAALHDELGLGKGDFDRLVGHLTKQGVLVRDDADGPVTELAAMGFASPESHLAMLRDVARVSAYRNAIFAHARDSVVLDIGTGSGALGLFAVRAGAKHVYAIEESEIAALAEQMIEANGARDAMTVLRGHSRDIELPERVDIIVHELLGTDPFEENLLTHLRDARERFLRPGGRLIPWKVDVCCVALEPDTFPGRRERRVREAEELSGLYGLDFGPLADALARGRRSFLVTDAEANAEGFTGRLLSDECVVRSIDLRGDDLAVSYGDSPCEVPITIDGRLGAVVVFFRAHLDETLVLSTSPYRSRTHWGWTVHELGSVRHVARGDRVTLVSRVGYLGSRQTLTIDWP
jgi:SAM-dependent methyltransferase